MEENPNPSTKTRKHLGSILWPLILILIGILLLLDTLGLLGQSAWKILWNLWPILFIALGLDALFRKKEIFGPVFWIGLGSVLILGNFNILGWDIVTALFRLWPLLLVTAGLDLLLGRRSIWLSLLITTLILGVIIVALGFTGLKTPTINTTKTPIKEPLGEAEKADISIAMAVGQLELDYLHNSDSLIEGVISTDGSYVRSSSSMRGKTIVYTLEHNNPATIPFDNVWKWNLSITRQVPINLSTSIGAGLLDLFLDEKPLENLTIKQGVGDIVVRLPADDFPVEIAQAIGKITIEIPKEIPIRFHLNRAVTGLSIPPDFVRQNDYYYSPAALKEDDLLTIEVNQAIGTINIRYGQ